MSDRKNPLAPFGLNEDGTPMADPFGVIDDGITDDPFGDRPRRGPSKRREIEQPAEAPDRGDSADSSGKRGSNATKK